LKVSKVFKDKMNAILYIEAGEIDGEEILKIWIAEIV